MNNLVDLEAQNLIKSYSSIGLRLGHCAAYGTTITPIGHVPNHFFQFFGYHSESTNTKCNVTNPLLLETAEHLVHHQDGQVFVVPSFFFS